MKTENKRIYEAPSVRVIDVQSEGVLAYSGHVGGGDINDFGPGSEGDYDLE